MNTLLYHIILFSLLSIAMVTNSMAKEGGAENKVRYRPSVQTSGVYNNPPGLPGGVKRTALRHIIRNADLIFYGVVKRVEYKSSIIKKKNDIEMPHTFITFAIEKIFKGKTTSKTITLRFQGGRTKTVGGQFEYLISPAIPLFDIGDRDILFVKKNGQSICPLVGWRNGRLRVIDNQIYTDHGYPVALTEKSHWSIPLLRNDFVQPLDLFDRLLRPRSKIDKHLSGKLGKKVHQSMQTAMKAGMHSASMMYAKHLLAQSLNEITGINEYINGAPPDSEPKTPPQVIPYRLLTPKALRGVRLRSQTKTLLAKDPATHSFYEGVLLNRLLLEDYYDPFIVRSLKKSLIRKPFIHDEMPYSVLKAVKTHEALGKKLTLEKANKNPCEHDGVASMGQHRAKDKTATFLSADSFMAYLKTSIEFLHKQKQLKDIPPVKSMRIDEPFYVKPLRPARPAMDLSELESGDEKREKPILSEVEAMEDAGFNPVLQVKGIK